MAFRKISEDFLNKDGSPVPFYSCVHADQWVAFGFPHVPPLARNCWHLLRSCGCHTGLTTAFVATKVWGSKGHWKTAKRNLDRLQKVGLANFKDEEEGRFWFALIPQEGGSFSPPSVGHLAHPDGGSFSPHRGSINPPGGSYSPSVNRPTPRGSFSPPPVGQSTDDRGSFSPPLEEKKRVREGRLRRPSARVREAPSRRNSSAVVAEENEVWSRVHDLCEGDDAADACPSGFPSSESLGGETEFKICRDKSMQLERSWRDRWHQHRELFQAVAAGHMPPLLADMLFVKCCLIAAFRELFHQRKLDEWEDRGRKGDKPRLPNLNWVKTVATAYLGEEADEIPYKVQEIEGWLGEQERREAAEVAKVKARTAVETVSEDNVRASLSEWLKSDDHELHQRCSAAIRFEGPAGPAKERAIEVLQFVEASEDSHSEAPIFADAVRMRRVQFKRGLQQRLKLFEAELTSSTGHGDDDADDSRTIKGFLQRFEGRRRA